MRYSSYLICNGHIPEVAGFLRQFFSEDITRHSWSGWVTFKIADTGFSINLMEDKDQSLTQNMTFEIYCQSRAQLEEMARKYEIAVHNFLATSAPQHYRYHYAEAPGPHGICKIEISYVEDLTD